ncbi:MAG TPA: HD domain-containing phosphohydrolase [Anaerolineaceae bacterium]|nr:HD domain-containing phosphohydrolase [Anaerolineaceae bacterium]
MSSSPMAQSSASAFPNRPILHNPEGFNHLAENAHEIMYRYRFTNPRGFEYINPVAYAVTGFLPDEFYADSSLFFRIHHPEDREVLKQILAGENVFQPVTVRWIRKDGAIVWVSEEIVVVCDPKGKVIAMEGIARQLPPTSQEVIEQRRRLLDISQSIVANFSLEDVLTHILSSMEDLLIFDRCELRIREDLPTLQKLLRRVNPNHISTKLVIGMVSTEDAVEAQVLESGKPQFINLPNPVDVLPPLHWAVPYESRMIVPMATQNGIPGVVHLSRLGNAPFTEADFDLAQLCVGFISLTIENIHLCKENLSHNEVYAALMPITENRKPFRLAEMGEVLGKSALNISGANRVGVYQHENNDQLLHLWSSGLSTAYIEKLIQNHSKTIEKEALNNSEFHFLPDVAELPSDSTARKRAAEEGYQAVALCPLVYGKDVIASVDCYYDDPHEWTPTDKRALELFSHQAAVAMENTRLFEELEEAYIQTVVTLAKALNIRDAYTADHSHRLADWAEATARRLDFDTDEIQTIRWAAMLHDIGKIGIPDSILRKPGPLTDEEWKVMRTHPVIGAEIVAPIKRFQPLTTLIRAHQEKFDGSGYPDGLRGDEIPLGARILTVVDAFGAMTDERVFRKARSKEEAMAELMRCAGTHFDSDIVKIFNEVITVEPISSQYVS